LGVGTVKSTVSFMQGDFNFKINIPYAPTAGDSRIFGLYSRIFGTQNAIYFFISGTNFYARSYGTNASLYDTTTITWNSAWTATDTIFTIRVAN